MPGVAPTARHRGTRRFSFHFQETSRVASHAIPYGSCPQTALPTGHAVLFVVAYSPCVR